MEIWMSGWAQMLVTGPMRQIHNPITQSALTSARQTPPSACRPRLQMWDDCIMNTELSLPEFSESCRFDRNRCQLDIEVSRGCSRYARESPSKSLSSQDILIAYLFMLFPLTCVINREPWIHGCCIFFGIGANLLIASMLVWTPRQLLLLNCSSLSKTPQIAIPM